MRYLMAVLFVVSAAMAQPGPIAMHGMVTIQADGSEISCAGSWILTDGGFTVRIWQAPPMEIKEGRQNVMIGYRDSGPTWYVILYGPQTSMAITPADPLWRQMCRDLDGFIRFEPRTVRVTRDDDGLLVEFRYAP